MRTRAQPAAEPLSGADRRPFSSVVVDMDAGLRMMGAVEVVPGGVPVGMRVAAVVPAVPRAARLPLFAESAN